MNDDVTRSELLGQTRTLQIVCGGLMAGCLLFMAIAVGLILSGAIPPLGTAPVLTYLGAAVSAFFLLARAAVPSVVTTQARRAMARGNLDKLPVLGGNFQPHVASLVERAGDTGRLAAVYGSQAIVGMALLEGCCFMNLVFFVLEHNPLALGIALAILGLMAINFPTHERMVEWIDNQLRWARQRREPGP